MTHRVAVLFAIALSSLAIAGSSAPGAARPTASAPVRQPGAVYFETNSKPTNFVQVFYRKPNGRLKKGPHVYTGGSGNQQASPFAKYGFKLLDSANPVVLSKDRKFLFVVNAGDDSVSSFRVSRRGVLKLASHVSSGGDLPVSVATALRGKKRLVYVVNEWSGNIRGYTVSPNGKLHILPGSDRSLVTSGKNGAAAMIGFDNKAQTLTVTERGAIFDPVAMAFIGSGPERIDVFKVLANGRTGPPVSNTSVGEDPFGFAYTKNNTLFMTDSGVNGTVTTYSLNPGALSVTPLDHKPAGGSAPCWVVFSNNEKFAWVTNSLTANVSSFSVAANGGVTLLGEVPATNNSTLDEDSSRDGRYLYVISTKVVGTLFTNTLLDIYRTNTNGTLTHIGKTGTLVWPGASGVAAF
jgi:6-phosphogluconolactonase